MNGCLKFEKHRLRCLRLFLDLLPVLSVLLGIVTFVCMYQFLLIIIIDELGYINNGYDYEKKEWKVFALRLFI